MQTLGGEGGEGGDEHSFWLRSFSGERSSSMCVSDVPPSATHTRRFGLAPLAVHNQLVEHTSSLRRSGCVTGELPVGSLVSSSPR